MEKISWTDHVRNEAVLLRVQEQRNILHEIRKRKANWIGHILHRNCLLQRVIEGKIKGGIEVTGRRGRKRRNLLDDLKERRGYSHLKDSDFSGEPIGPIFKGHAVEEKIFFDCMTLEDRNDRFSRNVSKKLSS